MEKHFNFKDRTGEIVKNYQGYWMTIVKYRHGNDITIEFDDKRKTIRENVLYSNFSKGIVKNPLDKFPFEIQHH